jgi:hypothetical protein
LYSAVREIHNYNKYVNNFENWLTYVMDWMGLFHKGDNLTYRFRSGKKCIVRAGSTDRIVVNNILVNNAFMLDRATLRKCRTIIDVGTHIG